MHKDFQNLEQIEDALAQKKHRMHHTTLKGQEEAQMVKDINKLEKSIPMARELEPIMPQIKEINANKKEIWNKLDKVRG
jgi:uncharacterized coiled-coil DUF342 family protein